MESVSRVENNYQYAKMRCRELEEENRKQKDQLADLRIEMGQLRHNSKQEEHDKQIEILNTRIAKIYLDMSTERKYWQTKYKIPCSKNNVSGEHEISSNLSHNHFETSHDILQDPPKHETMASASSAHLVPRLSNEPKQVLLPDFKTSATMTEITPSQPAVFTQTSIQPEMTLHQQPYVRSNLRPSLQLATDIPLLPQPELNQSLNDCQKNAIKLKSYVNTRLTINGLRQEDNKGRQLLNKYFLEVEQHCPYDSIRVAMIPLTAEPCLLNRLKLDNMHTLQQLSWAEVKRKLISYLPKVNPEDAERELLEMTMTVDDDVEAFAATMMINYYEACQLLDVIELEIPLQDILAFTMTSNMRQEMMRPYEDAIKRDHESAIRRLEKAFRNKTYKESVFLPTRLKAKSLSISDISGRYSLPSDTRPNFNERERSPGIDKHQILRSWNDWKCVKCEHTNRATWFICDQRGCEGQATERQTPRNSWNCVPDCGQTNLRLDHYCHSCLRPNNKINPDRIREPPPTLKQQPRNRHTWFSSTPVLEP